jgi:hypothetical protein
MHRLCFPLDLSTREFEHPAFDLDEPGDDAGCFG